MKVVFAVVLGGLILIFGGVLWFSRVLAIGAAVVVAVVIGGLYHSYLTAPECDADDVTFQVSKDLSSKFPSGAITVRNVRMVTGGFFSSRNDCEMEVAPMGGFGAGSMQSWAQVAYSTSRLAPGGVANVEVRRVGPLVADRAEKPAD
jgi:hypothetical protein